MQGLGTAKQGLLKMMLSQEKFDIVAFVETQRDDDHPVSEVHGDYAWIGKNRKDGKGGGIGFMTNAKSVTVLDHNLLNFMDGDLERLWISMKVDKVLFAVGVVYLPVDNVPSNKEAACLLYDELIENVARLQQHFQNIILFGDFNGKLDKFRGTKPSSNGKMLENLIEATNMVVMNTSDKCQGQVTWHRGPLSSTIDYMLVNDHVNDLIQNVLIDEEQIYSLGSDHNFITSIINVPTARQANETDSISKWNISEKTSWTRFENQMNEALAKLDVTKYCHPNDLWLAIKSKIISVAENTIGHKSYKNKHTYWDKEVASMIQDRRAANRLSDLVAPPTGIPGAAHTSLG